MKSSLKHFFRLMFLIVACFNMSVFYCNEIPIFNSMNYIEKYARLTDEYGLNGMIYPKEPQSIKTRIARFFGASETLWEPSGFKKLLRSIIQARSFSGFIGDCIEKIEPEPGRKFVVFGSLEGQFHSFVRCLQCLVHLKILDHNLTIINPSYVIIFNGNSRFDNFYDLEVLTVILQLMTKNQDKIFYVKNKCEENNMWHKTHLMRQLKDKLQLYNLQVDEYVGLVDQFFNMLPRALFLVNRVDEKNIDLVKCANIAMELHEEDLSEFFVCRDSSVVALTLLQPKKSRVQIHVSAVISAGRLEGLGPQAEKLEHYLQKNGVTQWSFGSLVPDRSSIRDFFGVVTTAKNLDNWVISLMGSVPNRPCVRIKTFNVFNGKLLTDLQYQSCKKQSLQERLEFFESEIDRIQKEADESKLIKLEIELASLENRPVNPKLMKTLRKEVSRAIESPVSVEERKD